MESMSVLAETGIAPEYHDLVELNSVKENRSRTAFNPDIVNLITEGGINFFRYIKRMGLAKEPDLLLLSSKHHYYYDESDLKKVKALINLKSLNLIKHLDSFLASLAQILPHDATFIGCFASSKNNTETLSVHFSRLFTRFLNLLDSRTDRDMDKTKVAELLEAHGLKIIDMTEINGITYFYSQNVNKALQV